jgi:hypothetical protein
MHYNLDYRGPQVYRAGSLLTGLRGYYHDFYNKGSLVGPSKPMTTEERINYEIYTSLNNFRLPPGYPVSYFPSLKAVPNKAPLNW